MSQYDRRDYRRQRPRTYRKPSRRTTTKRKVRKHGRTVFFLFLPLILVILAKCVAAWEAGLVQ